MTERWLVLCLDDNQTFTFASHGYFATRVEAEAYAATVAIGRAPIVAYGLKDFYRRR